VQILTGQGEKKEKGREKKGEGEKKAGIGIEPGARGWEARGSTTTNPMEQCRQKYFYAIKSVRVRLKLSWLGILTCWFSPHSTQCCVA
jgi:hypothetical protein